MKKIKIKKQSTNPYKGAGRKDTLEICKELFREGKRVQAVSMLSRERKIPLTEALRTLR